MPRPYIFGFEKPVVERTDRLPPWSRYSFTTSHQHSFKTFGGAEFASQRLSMPPFHVELFEIKTDNPFQVHYEMPEKQYFLFFMLEGRATFTTPEGFYISCAKSRHFSFVLNEKGKYLVHIPPGRHTILCITLKTEWLTFFSEDQPALRDFLKAPAARDHLPYCTIDRPTGHWLTSLYSEFRQGKGSLDGQLRYYISLILERYNHLAGEKLRRLPWRTKRYLDNHFRDTDLAVPQLAVRLALNERSLRRQFKTEFGVTLHHYYTCLRLAEAARLMQHHKLPLNQVYLDCGYNDESTFRYALKKFGLSKISHTL